MSNAPAVEMTPYQRLKLMILDGAIGQGEPLVERSVAARLGVSRTPVRETILRLEREGLVRIVEGKGAFVAHYSIEDVIEIYQVRQGLEPIAARLSCEHIAMDEVRYFEEQLGRFRTNPSLRNDESGAWERLGRDFHRLVIRSSRNKRLIQIVEGMQDQIDLVRGIGRTISRHTSSESTLLEHSEILRALKARDPDRAEAAVRAHLENGLRHRLDGFQLMMKGGGSTATERGSRPDRNENHNQGTDRTTSRKAKLDG
jgi:DNA-binding GntR family transcriptional regulator